MKDKNTDQIDDIREDPFEEYIRMGEPDKADKAYAWQTAVGLQDVDKLRPSEYLLNVAKENIDGNISIGFNVTKDVFAKYAWYFRNSLVRANYQNVKNGVYGDMSFLEAFLRNLLMGEKNELKNRYMHIRWNETTHLDGKQHIQQHIVQHIEEEDSLLEILEQKGISSKMKANIMKLHKAFGREKVFGRSDVIEVLGITERPASTLLGKMYSLDLTEKVTGAGKGKYRFII